MKESTPPIAGLSREWAAPDEKNRTLQWLSWKVFLRQHWAEGCGGNDWEMTLFSLVDGEVMGWCFRILIINSLVPASLESTCLWSAQSHRPLPDPGLIPAE